MDKGEMLVTLTFFAKTNYQLLSLISVNHHSVVLSPVNQVVCCCLKYVVVYNL